MINEHPDYDAQAWMRIEHLLDALIDVPAAQREAELKRLAGADMSLHARLAALVAQFDVADDRLDAPLLKRIAPDVPASCSLPAGTRVGAYRIGRLIGHGGMGEVYRAARCDGQYQQTVALKLIRQELLNQTPRFHAERQLLARLRHPGIAQLLDGGVHDDGRPYMVMELVEGLPIVEWCRTRRCPLEQRLRLFIAVCDAVAEAHRNLVVHRDLKPSNVLVTAEGTVKLLDFGIARLLDGNEATQTRQTPLTLFYAAPEQLMQGTVTTATDVYALGVLLFEVLTEIRHGHGDATPLAAAMNRLVSDPQLSPSRTAMQIEAPPVPAHSLRGDLDAIVAMATRSLAADRYPDARALSEDLTRVLNHRPVRAREGARLYVIRRFTRRHWLAIASAATVFLALIFATFMIGREARVAHHEAARAEAVKDFLIDIFRANDPRRAQSRPTDGELGVRALLDSSVERIERDFANDPEMQLELLGITADLYYELNDEAGFRRLQQQRLSLARERFGARHPLVIRGLLQQVGDDIFVGDHDSATRLLREVDDLLDDAGQQDAELRAQWWLLKSQNLPVDPAGDRARQIALKQSIALFERRHRDSAAYAMAEMEQASLAMREERFDDACSGFMSAIAIAERAPDRADDELAMQYRSLARCQQMNRRFDEAFEHYERAAGLATATYGQKHCLYWLIRSDEALMLMRQGKRQDALSIMHALKNDLVPGYDPESDLRLADEAYGEIEMSDGRDREAIRLLAGAERNYGTWPYRSYDSRDFERALGEAYERSGQLVAAAQQFEAAFQRAKREHPDGAVAVDAAHERVLRFAIAHADPHQPGFQFSLAVLDGLRQKLDDKPLSLLAMLDADDALAKLKRGRCSEAVQSSLVALQRMEVSNDFYDVRELPRLWLQHSRILNACGHPVDAYRWAVKALDADLHYQSPDSASVSALRRELAHSASYGPRGDHQ